VNLQIRTATRADLDAIQEVYRRSSLSNERDRDALLAHPDALDFAGDGIGAALTIVAVVDGMIVGFATAGPVVDGTAELDDLFVDPDRHRRGIGRALMGEIAARARSAGGSRVEVTANSDALGFYRSVGFRAVGEAETRFGPAPRMSVDIRDEAHDQP